MGSGFEVHDLKELLLQALGATAIAAHVVDYNYELVVFA